MANYTIETTDGNTTLSGLVAGDTVTFGTGFNHENFSFLEDGDDLLIYTDNGTTVRLVDQLLSSALVSTLIFNDGGNIDLSSSNLLIGTTATENISGTSGNDLILGGTGNNTNLDGNGGDDIIYAGDGDDTVYGGAGNDTIYGGEGNDTLYDDDGTGADTSDAQYLDILYGGAGDDFLYSETSWEGELYGGTGDDTYTVKHNSTYELDVTIEDEQGSSDKLVLNNDDNTVYEKDGLDLLIYNQLPSTENNTLIQNQFALGKQIETLEYTEDSLTLNLVEKLTSGNDNYYATSSTSEIGLEHNIVDGGAGNDIIRGQDGEDTLYGGDGSDNLRGGNGDDILFGGNDFDRAYGGNGNDTIYGSAGNDFLYGQGGNDLFIFNDLNDYLGSARNVIKGGFDSSDVINIADLIEYDGTGLLSDFVALTDNGTNTTVSVDPDGGVNNYTQVVIIQNTTGVWTDAQDMVNQGNLIVM